MSTHCFTKKHTAVTTEFKHKNVLVNNCITTPQDRSKKKYNNSQINELLFACYSACHKHVTEMQWQHSAYNGTQYTILHNLRLGNIQTYVYSKLCYEMGYAKRRQTQAQSSHALTSRNIQYTETMIDLQRSKKRRKGAELSSSPCPPRYLRCCWRCGYCADAAVHCAARALSWRRHGDGRQGRTTLSSATFVQLSIATRAKRNNHRQ
jgi:hypothetical protein